MAAAGPKFTGTGANFNDGGTLAWTNPTNVQGDTTTTAATVNLAANGNTSQRLRCSNFGFTTSDIPSGATIVGVTVEVEQQAANANRHRWNSVRLLVGGSEAGNDNSDASAIPTAKGFKTFGGASDGWGAGLTDADVRASGFGVSLKVDRNSAQATTTSLFRVRVTVEYTTPQSYTQTPADGLGLTDSATPARGLHLSQGDGLALTDARALGNGRILADGFALTDSAAPTSGGGADAFPKAITLIL